MNRTDILARARDYIAKESDRNFREEVEALIKADDSKELEDRFYRDLEFGTGGLRGVIGGGYNRMNSSVVSRATQGLCDYLNAAFRGKNLSACIAYDSRHYSDVFALDTALVFAANGIKAYLFSSLRPTPELSFAIRQLGADTGVVVTASHNPPAYNGYKAYWNDGSQVIAPHDEGIIERVNAVNDHQVDAEGRGPGQGPPRHDRQGDRRPLRRHGQVAAPSGPPSSRRWPKTSRSSTRPCTAPAPCTSSASWATWAYRWSPCPSSGSRTATSPPSPSPTPRRPPPSRWPSSSARRSRPTS